MKSKHIEAYMKTAEHFAECSTATRLHVGAVVVKEGRIISIGYNGMPSGWDNNCESKEFWKPEFEDLHYDELDAAYPFVATSDVDGSVIGRYKLKTKPEVLHAETNAIAKLARSTESGNGATIFITHAPCLDCAKLVYQSGINSVYYRNTYRSEAGLQFLQKAGIEVNKI